MRIVERNPREDVAPAGESAATSCWRDREMRARAVIRRNGAANCTMKFKLFIAFGAAVLGEDDKTREAGS